MKLNRDLQMNALIIAILGSCLLVACSEPVKEKIDYQNNQGNVSLPSIPFTNITESYNITTAHVSGEEGRRFMPSTFGGGVAFFDFNNDGYPDLLSVSGKSLTSDSLEKKPTISLLKNIEGKRFEEVTSQMGLSTNTHFNIGIAIGDINGDNWLDIYITGLKQNSLYLNQAGKGFTNITEEMGVTSVVWSADASFFDVDQDGDLDLLVGNYVEWSEQN